MGLRGEGDPTVVNPWSVMKLSYEEVRTRMKTAWSSSLLFSLGFMRVGHRTSIQWRIKIGRRRIMGKDTDEYHFS